MLNVLVVAQFNKSCEVLTSIKKNKIRKATNYIVAFYCFLFPLEI